MPVTGHGPASRTVTRSTRPSSMKSWVIPSFLARIAGIRSPGEADLDVDAGGQVVEALERVDRLRRRLMDVDEPLVRADLEVLARVLVLEGRADHAVDVLLRWQRNGAGHGGAGARRRLDDLLGRGLDGRVVVRLQANADLVLSGGGHVLGSGLFPSYVCGEVLSGLLREKGPRPAGAGGTHSEIRIRRFHAEGGRSAALARDLLDDLGDDARADGAATLADGEPQALIHGDRLDELDLHLDVVAGHDHLDALGQLGHARHVGGAEVELRAVAREERRVAPALFLLEDVHLCLELGVRRDRPGLAQHLAALDLLALGAAQEAADVVAGLTLVEDLAEHLDTGHDAGGRVLDADDLHRVTGVDHALLDAPGGHGPAAGDREDVLDRHQERAIQRTLGLGDVGVELLGKLDDLGRVGLVALARLERRAGDEGDVVAREVVLGEQVADLDLDELEELLVVDHVRLVEEDDHVGHADLAREQDVLARLGHGSIGRRDDQDRAVHLRGARDHVLDVVRVARAVHVGVVAVARLVLDVRRRDRDAALTLLGSVVDLVERTRLAAVRLGQYLRDGSGQRRLAMVDVTDGPDVDMRLVALELLLGHVLLAPL